MFHQFDPAMAADLKQNAEIVDMPAFVGIHDEARIWRGGPNGAEPLGIARSTQFDLEKRQVCRPGCCLRHGVGGAETDGEGRLDVPRKGNARQVRYRGAGNPGLQIPERAIDCIAGSARGHGRLQLMPGHAGGNGRGHGLKRCNGRFRCLAIARIGRALAPADLAVALQRYADHHGLSLAAAGNGEMSGNREALDGGGQCSGHGSGANGTIKMVVACLRDLGLRQGGLPANVLDTPQLVGKADIVEASVRVGHGREQ